MRKVISLFCALFVMTFAYSQRIFATLQHEGNVSVYYGQYALSQAHSAAVAGDIITLSPGMFNAVNITKNITIRGAGMFADTAAGTTPTYISGQFYMRAPEDAAHFLTMEGLYFMNDVKFDTLYNPQFSKCLFHTTLKHYDTYSSSSYMNNAVIVNCIVTNWFNANYNSRWYATGTVFQNSVIISYNGSNIGSPDILTNCIVNFGAPYNADTKTINNCILFYYTNSSSSGSADDAITSWYSIGITSGGNYFHSSMLTTHNLYNYNSFSAVFKYFNGTYNEGTSFELQDSIATTRLGNDGTQIGIYGGAHPFNPRVANYKITVPSESNPSGQLPVTIQAIGD
ncbi:MAG: hypothetical protein J5848_07415 [Bacteroidales bacterium]|nr:hypothetical protein [Bacteroidales bacterium]